MSKRFDSKKLFYIFAALLIILFITFLTKIPREKSTLKKAIVSFDTSAVERIRIKPRFQDGGEFGFFRENGEWKIKQGNIVSRPREGAVANILNDLITIKPSALVAVSEEKWKDYYVDDSLGIRIIAENRKGKKLADVVIGRFSYKPVNNPYGGYGGGSVDGTSYIRQYDDKAVYSVNGFLTFSFSGGFDDWRDKTLIHAASNEITKISFTFPADSSYVLEKKDKTWYIGETPADSAKTSDYLGDLIYANGEKFADGFKPDLQPLYKIVIEGNNLLSITVKCWKENDGSFILNSSLNPDSYFESKADGVISHILKPASHFRNAPRR
mgnify:CR=1 FL=1